MSPASSLVTAALTCASDERVERLAGEEAAAAAPPIFAVSCDIREVRMANGEGWTVLIDGCC
jgi:hypothetical protein